MGYEINLQDWQIQMTTENQLKTEESKGKEKLKDWKDYIIGTLHYT